MPGVPAGATVWRILYHSTTIYGADVAESGYVIAPSAPPPAGGYPVIAWAHGTSGFAAPCAPSLFTDSGGGSGPYLLPSLDRYLAAGYVVSAADYQGLGVSDGVHPYLLGTSEGRSVLDATRATRALPGLKTADAVVIYGHSQGGHAALFAAEQAPTYAPDLHVVGVVAAAPATGLSTLISIVGTPTGAQFLPYSIPTSYAWTQTYTDLPESAVFTPAGAAFASAEVTHGCSDQVAAAIESHHLTPSGVFLAGASSDPTVVAHARLNDPGQRGHHGADAGRPGHRRRHGAAGPHRHLRHVQGLPDRGHRALPPRDGRHPRDRGVRGGPDHRVVDERQAGRIARPHHLWATRRRGHPHAVAGGVSRPRRCDADCRPAWW